MSRSITGAIAALAVGAVLVAGCSSGGGKSTSTSAAGGSGSSSASGPSEVSFNGVTLSGASDLANKPTVQSKSHTAPTALQVKDVVTGDGPAASPTASVTVQYVGVKYADGKQFDASWDHGGATSFSLQQVVPGFTQGIGGNGTVAPMKVGGRRIMILPASLGYGAQGTPDGTIGPNTPLVFVVDLVGVNG
ncbi:MAG TPA: FKBP-type peptidyl-prolyl cis-trans isomerase [Jatrophihabitans sp.]|nr:FKBP-type peptidyl-prolyl cis-trans isomerase [Jatrophihabitans sp.]